MRVGGRTAGHSAARVGAAALCLALAGAVLSVHPARAGDKAGFELSQTRMRFIVPARPAAGYFTLKNTTDAAAVLVGASSPGCGRLMLHRSMAKEGSMAMESVERLNVPAHGSAAFEPGGYHLMCMKPAEGVRPGKSVSVTLTFADGDTLTNDFAVHGPGG